MLIIELREHINVYMFLQKISEFNVAFMNQQQICCENVINMSIYEGLSRCWVLVGPFRGTSLQEHSVVHHFFFPSFF